MLNYNNMHYGIIRIVGIFLFGKQTNIFKNTATVMWKKQTVRVLISASLEVRLNKKEGKESINRLVFLFFTYAIIIYKKNFSIVFPPNYSVMWCGLCHLYTVCNRTDDRAVNFIHCTSNGSAGRPHHWTARSKKFRTKTTRATHLVDCIGRLFGVHNICYRLQFTKHNHRTEIWRKRGSI